MGKILFDLTVCQPLGNIKYHGGGTYGYIIFKRLCEKDVSSVIAYIDKSRFIDPSIKECIEHKNIQVIDAHDVDLTKALQNNISLLYSPLFRSEYLKLRDYILLYLILIIMSYVVSLKFAKKLFKNSAITTLNEEV